MKKALSLLSLAVLTVGLLGSCSKINERLDNLEKKVSGIENEQIATINTQIDGIKTSIADLGTIRSDISSLKQSASDHSVDIFNLEEADRALKDRIVNLEDYVDAVLPNYAEKEWVEATFSTLEQYEATCDTIAKIDARIGSLDTKLSKDIKACADSLTKWVNKQFEGYYTAAEMDAKLAQMKSAIDSSKASGKISDAKADSIATELTNAKTAVDTAKANIRKEYRAAIKSAIETSEGKLTKEITEKITAVNTAVTNLTKRVDKIDNDVKTLTEKVEALEKMIQTVTIVPAYSDGSVRAEDDTLYLDCIIGPASTVNSLTKTNFTVLVNKVLTKAVNIETINITDDKWFSKNPSNGTVSLKIPVKNYIPTSDDSTITVAVKVNYVHSANLASDYTTEFVPVSVAGPDIPEGALSGVFSVSATKKVQFSQGNLTYNVSTATWAFYENQYDCATGYDSNLISLFTWGYNAEKSIVPDGHDSDNVSRTSGNLTQDEDWGCTIGDGKSWRTLTIDEWCYLFAFNQNPQDWDNLTDWYTDWYITTSPRYGLFRSCVTVCGHNNCIVLLPDDWKWGGAVGDGWQTTYSEETSVKWSAMEAAGAVCLLAAGKRNYGNSVGDVGGKGYYWSSTTPSASWVNDLYFDSTPEEYLSLKGKTQRQIGHSVRLVTDVK